MKQIYDSPQLLWITFKDDIITTSVEGDDNIEGVPETGWTPGT